MHIVLPIALVTAAATGILNVMLAFAVGLGRRSGAVSLGDGGNGQLLKRIRAHANLTEYAPAVLILIALIELAIGSPNWLAAVAALFVIGRVAHAIGINGPMWPRIAGVFITWLTLVGLGLYALTLPFDSTPLGAELPIELAPRA